MAVLRREVVLPRQRAKVFTLHLCVLLLRCDRWLGRPNPRRYESRRIIKLVNVDKMDLPTKPPSKTLRGSNCLDRHFREVDWYQNISNAQLFHAASMNFPRQPGLALLAKTDAFLRGRLPAAQFIPLNYAVFPGRFRETSARGTRWVIDQRRV